MQWREHTARPQVRHVEQEHREWSFSRLRIAAEFVSLISDQPLDVAARQRHECARSGVSSIFRHLYVGDAPSIRRTARTMATTHQSTSNHSAAFAAAANAIPWGECGAVRNGPPRTSHQTAMPGPTKSESGFLNSDGMAVCAPSNPSAAALAIDSISAARSHRRPGLMPQSSRLTGRGVHPSIMTVNIASSQPTSASKL